MTETRGLVFFSLLLTAVMFAALTTGGAQAGAPASPEDLQVGQSVLIEGWLSPERELMAKEVEILGRSKVRARIDSIDVEERSLVIHGVKVTTHEYTRVLDKDEDEIPFGRLARGLTVKIWGRMLENGTLFADEIEMRRSGSQELIKLEGAVEGVDEASNTLTVLGVPVRVSRNTKIELGGWQYGWFHDIAVGHGIEAVGIPLADGSMVASYVRVQRGNDVELEGPLDWIEGSRRVVGVLGVHVVTSPLTRYIGRTGAGIRFDNLREGSTIEVKGTLRDGKLHAEQIEIKSSTAKNEVEIHGTIEALDAENMTLLGLPVQIVRNTEFAFD